MERVAQHRVRSALALRQRPSTAPTATKGVCMHVHVDGCAEGTHINDVLRRFLGPCYILLGHLGLLQSLLLQPPSYRLARIPGVSLAARNERILRAHTRERETRVDQRA